MLLNVKDSHNQPFINKDGTLSQGINFYANNDSNYHQTVEEPTGKKDLIAYHNISQDNLDKAIQLGGLAVPAIAITKKETDFSNFGDITLLMPQERGESEGNVCIYPRCMDRGISSLPLQKEIPRSVMDYGDLYTPLFHQNVV